MTDTIFQIHDVHKHFHGVHAAAGVTLSVEKGEIRAIIGPNGAGKSTLFNIITGFVAPDHGRIIFEGRDITRQPPYRLFHAGISRTFQITSIVAELTVLENVQVALLSRDHKIFDLLGNASAASLDESHALLEVVGLKHFGAARARTLSHGDQKRLELAVAMSNKPRLLLLDEPTAGMAAQERIESITMVHRIARQYGLTVIFTEHDMQVVFAVADRISVLHQGRILTEGHPEEVRNNRQVQEIYLGEEIAAHERRQVRFTH